MYEQLASHQGLLVPVCLGVIGMLLPYPMVNCTLMTDMLLMSFAGLPLSSPKLKRLLRTMRRITDLYKETAHTVQELDTEGLYNQDDESNSNCTWCTETGRVMNIDFDQARILPRRGDDGDELGAVRQAAVVDDI